MIAASVEGVSINEEACLCDPAPLAYQIDGCSVFEDGSFANCSTSQSSVIQRICGRVGAIEDGCVQQARQPLEFLELSGDSAEGQRAFWGWFRSEHGGINAY